MIEIPRAALTADEIAKEAEFFSFGTNDLTQMTFGFSRDDAGKFLDAYYDKKIYENDPFAKLDQDGVGKLIKMAADLGKSTRPDIKLGICGEHGGDPSSVEFCHNAGPQLCFLLTVPCADRSSGCRSGCSEKRRKIRNKWLHVLIPCRHSLQGILLAAFYYNSIIAVCRSNSVTLTITDNRLWIAHRCNVAE